MKADNDMRKRTSLRRWKARCRAGRWIPKVAIVDYDLTRWFDFAADYVTEFYRARLPHGR